MDPTPTPWYKRDFDVHIALDKGLGSVLLLAATAVSLVLANSAHAGGFIGFWEHFHIGPASLGLHLNAHEWVNEGLMALFFFNVGLEIKREFVYGSLSNFRAALLPCVGALGGMIAPMGVYLALNSLPGGIAAGWAIPMATDIAFAMGVYNFFKNRMPPAVATFLLTLATVDDLGAIAVIAVCFAKGIVPMYLAGAAAICGALFIMCKKEVKNMAVHGAMGLLLWFALLKGGINADIAGVISALAIPAGVSAPEGSHAHAMESGMKVTLLDDLIHTLHPISSVLIMPLFALANCAVPVNAEAMGGIMTTPVGTGHHVRAASREAARHRGAVLAVHEGGHVLVPLGHELQAPRDRRRCSPASASPCRCSSSSRRSWACPSRRRRRSSPSCAPPASPPPSAASPCPGSGSELRDRVRRGRLPPRAPRGAGVSSRRTTATRSRASPSGRRTKHDKCPPPKK
jgi:NhaA family Na+:H+ antiporter